MEKDDKLQRLKDIEWTLNAIGKWAVNPSKYRKSHQNSIISALPTARKLVKTLIEDTEKEPEQTQENV